MKIKQNVIESYNEQQISLLANHVLNWYKAFFIQTCRLVDTEDRSRKRSTDKNELMPNQVESYLWVATLHHAVNGIQKLRAILNYHNDFSLDELCDAIAEGSFVEKLDVCRNANEHFDEYLCGQGHDMEEFECDLSFSEGRKIRSNQHWTLIVEDKWYIGALDVAEAAMHMKKYQSEITACLEKIADDYRGKGI